MLRAKRLHAAFDPLLDLFDHGIRRHAGGIDGLADFHGNHPGTLDEGVASPQQPGVMRHRHHRGTGMYCQPGATDAVFLVFPRRGAGALRKDGDPEALIQSLAAFCHQTAKGFGATAAVDGDRAE